MASDVKGYVVRGDYHNGACAWVCLGPSGEHLASTRSAERSLFPVLKDAIRAQADVWVIFDDVSIFRVYADGREEQLPSYKEALDHLVAVHEALAITPGETATGAARRVATELAQARAEVAAAHAMLDKYNAGNIVVDLSPANEIVDRPATLAERIEDIVDGHRASAGQACSLLDKASSDVLRMSDEIERLRAEIADGEGAFDDMKDAQAKMLAEIERLRAVSLEGEDATAWGRMEETVGILWNAYNLGDSSILTQAAADVLDAWHGCVDRKIIPPKPRDDADPLAALEAAERRMLASEGWVRIHGDPNVWTWPPTDVSMTQDQAMIIARSRALLTAKNGGA